MNFEVRALNSFRFDQFMSLRQKNDPQTGKPYTTARALTELGKSDPDCGQLCSPLATTTTPFDTKRNASR
jgi:cytochrome c oxidase subunit 2